MKTDPRIEEKDDRIHALEQKVERLREVLREVGVSGPYARVQYARPKRQCLACGSSALDRWYAEPAEPIQHKPDCKIASALSEETTDAD